MPTKGFSPINNLRIIEVPEENPSAVQILVRRTDGDPLTEQGQVQYIDKSDIIQSEIDDSIVSTDKTWSSQKITDNLAEEIAELKQKYYLDNQQEIDSENPDNYYPDDAFNGIEGYTLNRQNFTSKKYIQNIVISANASADMTFCIGSLDQNDRFIVRKEVVHQLVNGVNSIDFNEFLEAYEEVALKFPFNFNHGNVGSYVESPGKQYSTGLGYDAPLLLQEDSVLAMKLVAFDVIESPFAFQDEFEDLENRVYDLENRGLIVTAPNGESSEISRNDAGNLTVSNKEFFNILHLGNSILRHGITSYWWGDWGMAASIRENDYAHKFLSKIQQNTPSAVSDELNISDWEVNPTAWNKTLLVPYLEDKDLIIVRLGENVTDFSTYQAEYKSLIQYIQSQNPTAKIVIGGQFWVNEPKETKMRNVALELGLTYVRIDQLDTSENKSFIGAIVKGDDGLDHTVNNSGVAIHPGDLGMSRIADLLYNAISVNGRVIPYADEVNFFADGKANLVGGNNFTGTQTFNGNTEVVGNGDPNQVTVGVRNTKSIGDAQFNAVNNAGRSGKLFKAGDNYGNYKILRPNDLGFYNDPQGGDVAVLNDNPSGAIKMASGGKEDSDIFVHPNGNVGIGDNENPQAKLDVKGGGIFSESIEFIGLLPVGIKHGDLSVNFMPEDNYLELKCGVTAQGDSDSINFYGDAGISATKVFVKPNPTYFAQIGDLGIKTAATSSSTVAINPSTATAYRLNSGVSTVTLPVLTGNAGVILFLVNNSGNDIVMNSNTGANDIWSGGLAVNTETIPQSTPLRVLHDGTQWVIL